MFPPIRTGTHRSWLLLFLLCGCVVVARFARYEPSNEWSDPDEERKLSGKHACRYNTASSPNELASSSWRDLLKRGAGAPTFDWTYSTTPPSVRVLRWMWWAEYNHTPMIKTINLLQTLVVTSVTQSESRRVCSRASHNNDVITLSRDLENKQKLECFTHL